MMTLQYRSCKKGGSRSSWTLHQHKDRRVLTNLKFQIIPTKRHILVRLYIDAFTVTNVLQQNRLWVLTRESIIICHTNVLIQRYPGATEAEIKSVCQSGVPRSRRGWGAFFACKCFFCHYCKVPVSEYISLNDMLKEINRIWKYIEMFNQDWVVLTIQNALKTACHDAFLTCWWVLWIWKERKDWIEKSNLYQMMKVIIIPRYPVVTETEIKSVCQI